MRRNNINANSKLVKNVDNNIYFYSVEASKKLKNNNSKVSSLMLPLNAIISMSLPPTSYFDAMMGIAIIYLTVNGT